LTRSIKDGAWVVLALISVPKGTLYHLKIIPKLLLLIHFLFSGPAFSQAIESLLNQSLRVVGSAGPGSDPLSCFDYPAALPGLQEFVPGPLVAGAGGLCPSEPIV
jgi:hypothetical protein